MLTLIIYWCVIYKLRYLIKARGWVFVTGYGFLYFAKSMGKNLVSVVNAFKNFLIMLNN